MRYSAFALLLVALGRLLARIDFGWLAHDEGTLALAAQRVLAGDWPHRDFDDPYSGGLAFVDAFLFEVAGENFVVLRVGLLLVVLLTWLAVGKVLTRSIPWPGVVATLAIATLWSVGLYPTAMPSWYQAFLALGAGVALITYLRTGRWWMLALSGALAGLSIIIKITGVYTVAALLLALGGSFKGRLRYLLVWGPVGAAVLLVASAMSWQRAVVLLVPLVLVAAAALRVPISARVTPLSAGVLGIGVAIPVVGFLAVSAAQGALTSVLQGWFVLPRTRYDFATTPTDGGLTAIAAAFAFVPPLAALLVKSMGKVMFGIALLAFGVLVISEWAVGFSAFHVGVLLSPLIVGVLLLERRSVEDDQIVWASLLAFTALLSFPVSNFVYVLYSVPLAAVAVLSIAIPRVVSDDALDPPAPTHVGAAAVLAAAVFAGAFVVGEARSAIYANVIVTDPPLETVRLELDRAPLEVEVADGRKYNALIPRLESVANGKPIYAGPDLPQVYALAGLPSVAPVMFDFLTSRFSYADLPTLLEGSESDALVIDRTPVFSDEIPGDVLDSLETMYPEVEHFGDLELRWR